MVEEHQFNFKNRSGLPSSLKWKNEPSRWTLTREGLQIEPNGKTDFWQRTHYNMRADNGHFLYLSSHLRKFELKTRVGYLGKNEFDQSGLMVRISSKEWIKVSVEFQPGKADKLGSVVTNLGYSDWACQDFRNPDREILLRVKAERPDFIIEYALPSTPDKWNLIRINHLHNDREEIPLQVGIYCCSPKGAGFRTTFSHLTVKTTASN